MRNLDNKLKNKSINYRKLEEYGFVCENGIYKYMAKIRDDQFEIIVQAEKDKMTSMLMDLENECEYVLVDVEEATGKFVGELREEYESKLNEIIEKCTFKNAYKSLQAKEIIKYIKDKYNDDLEFLWEERDDGAVWRNKKNDKWYGVLMKIPKNRLGINSDEIVEVIDFKYQKGRVNEIIDNEKIFPGYHMNKQSWVTIKLDSTVETKKICNLIDNSYNLSVDGKTFKKRG